MSDTKFQSKTSWLYGQIKSAKLIYKIQSHRLQGHEISYVYVKPLSGVG